MPEIVVERFFIDDDNIEKFWRHGFTLEQILQVLDSPRRRVKRNRSARRASHLVVGRDLSGRCIVIPIEPTYDPVVWRPVTAWPCKPGERSWLT